MGFQLKINNDFNGVLDHLERQIETANEAVGLMAESHVVQNAPVGTPESTGVKNYHGGSLRKSITHKVIGNTVYVGTNMSVMQNGKRVSYPLFVELGTGVYAPEGNGRKSPWVWVDKNGKGHYTKGMKPRHFLRNALSKQSHINEYKKIYAEYLKKL